MYVCNNNLVKRIAKVKQKQHVTYRKSENRKSHPGEKINKWCAESMLNAINEFKEQNELRNAKNLTLRAIARAYNVPFETLRRRVKGKLSAAVAIQIHD